MFLKKLSMVKKTSIPPTNHTQPGLCVLTEGECLFELQPGVQLTSSVCMCPLHPPHNNRGSRMRGRAGSLNKTELDGSLWSHIPFILDLIFVERRQQTLQRGGTFLQASSDLRLGCPCCTRHTYTHRFTHTKQHTYTYISANTPSIPYFLYWSVRVKVHHVYVFLFISVLICGWLKNSTVHLQTIVIVLVTDCYLLQWSFQWLQH